MDNGQANSDGKSGVGNQSGVHGGIERGGVQPERDPTLARGFRALQRDQWGPNLDSTFWVEDAAASITELLSDLFSGKIDDYSDDAAWDVQNSAQDLILAIAKFREDAASLNPSEAPVGPSQAERL